MRFEFYKVYEEHELDRVYYKNGKIRGEFHHEPCRKNESYELDLTHCADDEFLAFISVISITTNKDTLELTGFLKYYDKGVDYYTFDLDSLIKELDMKGVIEYE